MPGSDRKIEVVTDSDVDEVVVYLRDEFETGHSQALAITWAEARELRDLLIEATSD